MQKGFVTSGKNEIWLQGKSSQYDEETALNEYVANSIDAIKKRIEILGKDLPEKKIDITFNDGEVIIKDNGVGMDIDEIKNNFFHKSDSRKATSSSMIGNFGFGAKLAFPYLCRENGKSQMMEIFSHKEGQKPINATWCPNNKVSDEYLYGFCEKEMEIGSEIHLHITRNKGFNVENYINKISQTFYEIIDDGIDITVDGKYVNPNDPLYRKNKKVIENSLFHQKEFLVKGEKVIVSYTEFFNEKILDKDELNPIDLVTDGGLVSTTTSGFYFKTNGQYFTKGNNLSNILGKVYHADCNGLRIEISIPKCLWDCLGMTYNKNGIVKDFSKIEEFKEVYLYVINIADSFKEKKSSENKETKKDKGIEKSLMGINHTISTISYNSDTDSIVTLEDNNNVVINQDKIDTETYNKHHIAGTLSFYVNVENWYKKNKCDLPEYQFKKIFEECYGKKTS